jgi:hypothetical protein
VVGPQRYRGLRLGHHRWLARVRYHGLLIAALDRPLGRTLLLIKLNETVACEGRDRALFACRWAR